MIRLFQAVFPGCSLRLASLTACQATAAAAEAAIVALMVPLLASLGTTSVVISLPRFAAAHSFHISFPTLLSLLGIAFVVRASAQASAVYLWAAGVERYEQLHRDRLLRGLLNAEHACQSREPAGRLQHVLTHHAECVARAFTALSWGGAHVVQIACLSLCAWFVSPMPALITVVALALIVALFRPLTKLGSAAAKSRADALGNYVHLIGQTLALLKELRIFGATTNYLERARASSSTIASTRRRQNIIGSLLPTLYQTAAGLLLLAGATWIYLSGEAAGTAPIVSLLLLLRATSAAQHLHVTYHQVQDSQPALEQLIAIEKLYADAGVPAGGLPLGRIDRLELRAVDFAYEADHLILSDVGMQVERGDVIGIVGPSGAGKSTLVQILLGLRTPDRGCLLLNGMPAELFRLEDFYARTAFVEQEPALFNETISECVRFGRSDVDDAEIRSVVAEAGLLEEIERQPQGYESLVGERGTSLSLGQRQRLCIARALVGEPDLLVFDEPTAALDAVSEEHIIAMLYALRGRAITFVVTHRPALLRSCNKVLSVGHGKVTSLEQTAESAVLPTS
ncbi:MAG: ABC transporter ATP-binding protein/permease [Planctomycetia bacterium]|nr:ABC transporter ATP-binding protein/permease [Planctomycetia bacterium]